MMMLKSAAAMMFFVGLSGLTMKSASVAAAPIALAANESPLLHHLFAGEQFSYSRIITYRTSNGIQHEHSTITLHVASVDPGSAKVIQTISVDGAPEVTRQITAFPDGRWIYTDHNSPAQDFATWDANELGPAPIAPEVGKSWQVDVSKSAMFAAGRATVRFTSLSPNDDIVEAVGVAKPINNSILDNDTHRYVPSSVTGQWTARIEIQSGIVQSFDRMDDSHFVANRNTEAEDNVMVSIRLVRHTSP